MTVSTSSKFNTTSALRLTKPYMSRLAKPGCAQVTRTPLDENISEAPLQAVELHALQASVRHIRGATASPCMSRLVGLPRIVIALLVSRMLQTINGSGKIVGLIDSDSQVHGLRVVLMQHGKD